MTVFASVNWIGACWGNPRRNTFQAIPGPTPLFFGSKQGGQTAAALYMYTPVQSARRNCVDVWPYLTDVLRRLPAIPHTDMAALETLLPDRQMHLPNRARTICGGATLLARIGVASCLGARPFRNVFHALLVVFGLELV